MIRIEMEPQPERPFERCCFCRRPTPYWTLIAARAPGAQVACCPDCAKKHRVSEVPTKKAWFDSEKLLNERPRV
jgi:hypothetical protein